MFIQTYKHSDLNRSRIFWLQNGEFKRFASLSLSSFMRVEHLPLFTLQVLKIEQEDICHYLTPEAFPFACSV
jgi:hypothetical protein